jgi:hypothetical protein
MFKPLVVLDTYIGAKGSHFIFGLNTLYSNKNKFDLDKNMPK